MQKRTAPSPAQQLRSTALRYGHPLAVGKAGPNGARPREVAAPRCWGTMDSPAPFGRAVRDPRLARLEAVLLLANEPIPLRKISRFASLADATEARTLTRRLNQLYDSQGTAFRVEEVAGGFQLLSRHKFGSWLRRLHQSTIETRLSGPALESLAIVAYRQPVLRAEIEAIRGVQCGEMLRQLMERDLVRISGRSEELGRPFLYGTTKRFLQVFGLRHLDELPRAEDLRVRQPQAAGSHETPESLSGNDPFNELTFQKVSPEESEVSIVADPELATLEVLEEGRNLAVLAPCAADEDADYEYGEDEEDEKEDDEDDDDDDDDDDDEEDEEFDDDFDDDDWEEVDDEEGEDDDEEDDDWEDDDEEEDDWEDDDEEEEEWEEGEEKEK